MPIEILRQNADTPECRAAQQAAILLGLPVRRINVECLVDHALAIVRQHSGIPEQSVSSGGHSHEKPLGISLSVVSPA